MKAAILVSLVLATLCGSLCVAASARTAPTELLPGAAMARTKPTTASLPSTPLLRRRASAKSHLASAKSHVSGFIADVYHAPSELFTDIPEVTCMPRDQAYGIRLLALIGAVVIFVIYFFVVCVPPFLLIVWAWRWYGRRNDGRSMSADADNNTAEGAPTSDSSSVDNDDADGASSIGKRTSIETTVGSAAETADDAGGFV